MYVCLSPWKQSLDQAKRIILLRLFLLYKATRIPTFERSLQHATFTSSCSITKGQQPVLHFFYTFSLT